MAICFIDLESIPSGNPIDPLSLTPPGNMKKAETIAEWHRTEAVTIAAEKYRQRALDSMAGEILCIGYAIDDDPVEVIMGESEYDTLSTFPGVVSRLMGRYDEPIQYVGWGIRGFDVPWLWRKAVKYQLTALKKSFNRDKGRGNILDLMEVWAAEWKDYRKMDDVAKFLGLSGKTEGMDGSKVYDYYLEGRLDEITEYCRQDVETIRSIYKRIYE